MKKVIETRIPVSALSLSTIADRVKKGHPGSLHPWWNRSPIASSSVLLATALKDAPKEKRDWASVLDRIRQIAEGGSTPIAPSASALPVVCDPFAGFGGLVMAAQKLGLAVSVSDLNPVSVILTKAVTEIPGKFQNQQAINPKAGAMIYEGIDGLAADVAYYGEKLIEKVSVDVGDLYPLVQLDGEKQEQTVFSWIWVRTMRCPNPVCGCEMPLAPSFVLATTKGKEYWAEPELEGTHLRFRVHQGSCPAEKETNKHGSKGAKFICPHCGHITQDEDVIQAGKQDQLNIRLMAVAVQTKQGRIFLAPDDRQIQAAACEMPKNIPTGYISHNARWFSPPRFGFTTFASLFTPRQMLLLTALCSQLSLLIDEVEHDGVKKQMANDRIPLEQNGKGAFAYSQAIGVYLSLLISKLTDFQSAFCTWDHRTGNIRSVFNRQALPMAWVFGEGNPFATPNGNLKTLLKHMVAAISCLDGHSSAVVSQADVLNAQFPPDSILFTELPYFDNVGYGELSDYFYVWLKKCLGNMYPMLFRKTVTPKEEICSIPEHFAGNTAVAVESYKKKIGEVFTRFYPNASKEYPSVVFFSYREKTRSTSFDFLLMSILKAGFAITGLWPVRSSASKKQDDLVRVAVVFRKREVKGMATTRRGFINALKRRLPAMLDDAYEDDILEEDQRIIGIGMGMQIFTEFHKIMNADGTPLSLPDALWLIQQEVREYCHIHAAVEQIEEE